MAMKYGVHTAYKKAEEAKKMFVEREIPDLSTLISKTDETIKTHSQFLSVLADEERVLIRMLMS
jgi:hypothetical protein